MSTSIQEAPIVGEVPTLEELELVAWGEEARKKAMDTLRDSLRQLITLTTALLAGSAVLFAQPLLHMWFKALGAACLMVSLGVALWGSMPIEAKLDVRCPDDVREVRDKGLKARTKALRWSSVFLFLAFGAVFAGFIVAAFSKVPIP